MKVTKQYFTVVLFVMMYKVVLKFSLLLMKDKVVESSVEISTV